MGLAGGLATNGQVGGGGSSTPAVAFGTAAARPAAAAGNANTAYYATDTLELTVSNGTAWNAIGAASGGAFFVVSGSSQGISFGSTGFRLANNQSNGIEVTNGSLGVSNPGSGLIIKEGANCKQGTATLVAGAATVANTSVTANSRILLTSNADGGTPGWLRVSARTAGTSFTITSSSATDTSTVAYQIFEPG